MQEVTYQIAAALEEAKAEQRDEVLRHAERLAQSTLHPRSQEKFLRRKAGLQGKITALLDLAESLGISDEVRKLGKEITKGT